MPGMEYKHDNRTVGPTVNPNDLNCKMQRDVYLDMYGDSSLVIKTKVKKTSYKRLTKSLTMEVYYQC